MLAGQPNGEAPSGSQNWQPEVKNEYNLSQLFPKTHGIAGEPIAFSMTPSPQNIEVFAKAVQGGTQALIRLGLPKESAEALSFFFARNPRKLAEAGESVVNKTAGKALQVPGLYNAEIAAQKGVPGILDSLGRSSYGADRAKILTSAYDKYQDLVTKMLSGIKP